MKSFSATLPLLIIFGCTSSFEKGEEAFRNKNFDEARIQFSKVEKKEDRFGEAQRRLTQIDSIEHRQVFNLAYSYYKKGNFEDAKPLLYKLKEVSFLEKEATQLIESIDSAQTVNKRVDRIKPLEVFDYFITTIADGYDVQRVNLFSSTDSNRKINCFLKDGSQIRVLKSEGEYYLVEANNGCRGYCMKGFVVKGNIK